MDKKDLLQSLKKRGIPENVIDAFSKVDREDFVPRELQKMAYEDSPLPISKGQTTSQPYTIAFMLAHLDVKKGQKVLEIGSGSGYALAIMAELIGSKGRAFGIERIPELERRSKKSLADYRNVNVYNRNGINGLEEFAPFDRIMISAALREIPEKIMGQLKNKGLLVAPKGSRFDHEIFVIQRKSGKEFEVKQRIPGFVFVPFIYED